MGKPYIKGGTPVGSESLCKTCCYAHIMTGYRESESVTMCNEVNPNIVVPFLIYECTGYYDKNRPSWKQMEKLAINVTPSPLKKVGFKVAAGFGNAEDGSTLVEDSDEEDDE
jgi:hypothetical protein